MEENNGELIKELSALELERSMTNSMINGRQNEMANMLLGSMGQDMEDVLSGKKVIKIKKRGFFKRILDSFDNFLKALNGVSDNGEVYT